MALSYIKLFSAMGWVLLLDELAAWQNGRPHVGRHAGEESELIKHSSFIEYLQCAGHRG